MNDRSAQPRRIVRDAWINVYGKDFLALVHKTKEDADLSAAPDRLACVRIRIDCYKGDGL